MKQVQQETILWSLLSAFFILLVLLGALFYYCRGGSCQPYLDLFRIDTYEECVEAGYPITDQDPPQCSIKDLKFIPQTEKTIELESPHAFEQVSFPFLIKGQAKTEQDQLFYQLLDPEGKILERGNISLSARETDELKHFEQKIYTELPEIAAGKLLISQNPIDGKNLQMIEVPLRFSTMNGDTFDPLSEIKELKLPPEVRLEVPFTPQAPFANWDPPYNEACEEASLIMVHYFLQDKLLPRNIADQEIIQQTHWQKAQGYAVDTSISEVKAIAEAYYDLKAKQYTGEQVSRENIKKLLAAGYPIIIPAAGQMLGNPNFRGAGPPYHMLVITGYDSEHFYTNDPGTRNGHDYAYKHDTIMKAIHDWTGSKETVRQGPAAMLVLSK